MKNGITCEQCKQKIVIARGTYRIVGIARVQDGYHVSWPSVYVHCGECEAAWRSANDPARVTSAEVESA